MFDLLSCDDVFAPITTALLPGPFADADFMMMPDGELRHYGKTRKPDGSFVPSVMKSHDLGVNWKLEPVEGLTIGGMTRSPWSGEYLRIQSVSPSKLKPHTFEEENMRSYPARQLCHEDGLYLFRGPHPDGTITATRIADNTYEQCGGILPLTHRKRWIAPVSRWQEEGKYIARDWGVLYSDDDGKTWNASMGKRPPVFQMVPPHKGMRWLYNGYEPSVVELSDGTLQILLRTSTDFHYQAFSHDGGETWTEPEASIFFATATRPILKMLSGNRLLAIWNNTTCMPELNHAEEFGADSGFCLGLWEDVFTNRDALHAAISYDDGKTWHGFRELVLNRVRNDADFRCRIDHDDCLDKSIHQTQPIELPNGKIALAYGQSRECNGILLFDPAFLLEKSRSDHFEKGMMNWSVHQYLISSFQEGINGHCAYNRIPGVRVTENPTAPKEYMVALVGCHPDKRLMYQKEGAVWNFPMGRQGTLKTEMYFREGTQGIRITMADCWINPSDPNPERMGVVSFVLTPQAFGTEKWIPITIVWDADTEECWLEGLQQKFRFARKTRTGISYLHLQSPTENSDPNGVLVRYVKAEVK